VKAFYEACRVRRAAFYAAFPCRAEMIMKAGAFVAEIAKCIYMLEPKARNDMEDAEVIAKKDSAIRWCQHATEHSAKNGGKPWKYLLIPHDAIAENMSITGLAAQFTVKPV
jgi:type III restriction enzyme